MYVFKLNIDIRCHMNIFEPLFTTYKVVLLVKINKKNMAALVFCRLDITSFEYLRTRKILCFRISKATFTHPVSTCIYQIELQF